MASERSVFCDRSRRYCSPRFSVPGMKGGGHWEGLAKASGGLEVGEECNHWSSGKKDVGRGQSQGFIQKGQRSGVYTERAGAFTVDSSVNPPAYEDREQIQFSLGKHRTDDMLGNVL